MTNKHILRTILTNSPFNVNEEKAEYAVQKIHQSNEAFNIISNWLDSMKRRAEAGEPISNLFLEAENLAYAYRVDLHDKRESYDSESYLILERCSVELIRFTRRVNAVLY